ncbi:DapH/DapD/GlmU-related protein [Paraburkholderia sp. CNPSo 3076]|uniref:DapH/DapD/GlmU-related protein n=1 Tax=Paraburkholderia sp. CNPSo 3076 TaxID=2940936 RepID=UPI002250D77E|nr:DapH/DapD/GlmU-related protein [Paraburkholderia sp. CNPSo 3076]MCX5539827.1 DapH/DapD/GlmU-related protein [Paraburkholderia sp. CNPSo 3076]
MTEAVEGLGSRKGRAGAAGRREEAGEAPPAGIVPPQAANDARAAEIRVIDLSRAGKGNFVARRGKLVQAAWYLVDTCVLDNRLLPLSALRAGLLRLFGAKIGQGCRLVHPMRVKAPWNLEMGDNCWIGVDVWIYNQAPIRIGSNVCLSQGAFLSAGSHDMRTNMDLHVAPIVIEDGAWVSSKCVVQMGVTIGRSAVVTPLSVVHRSLEAGGVYGGNPCRFIRWRFEESQPPQA